MSKHTPGPWEAGKAYKRDANAAYAAVFSPVKNGNHHTPRAAEALGLTVDEASANSLLIAAAPDLLGELRRVKDWMEDCLCEKQVKGTPSRDRYDAVCAAIARAEGGAA